MPNKKQVISIEQLKDFIDSNGIILPDQIKGIFLDQEEDGRMSEDHFENEWDVSELYEIVKKDKFQEFNNLLEFIMCAEMVCRPEDLHSIELCATYRLNYPAIYRTMEVWAWG